MSLNIQPSRSERFTVNPTLTPTPRKRSRRRVENIDYAAFVSRILKAHGRRIAAGDLDGLTALAQLTTELEDALTTAVDGLRSQGYSWTDIGTRLGITRQAAQQRWGPQQLHVSSDPDAERWRHDTNSLRAKKPPQDG